MSTVSNFVYRKACDDFLKLAPEIQEQNNVVKQLRKEQKANITLLRSTWSKTT